MAPLALPPGPYLEGFLANDGLRYTDGFNYHYYGYAEDFTGVYEQFRAAVAEGRKVGDSESQRAGRPEAQKAGKAEDQKARESEGQKSEAFDTPPSRPSDPPAFRPSGLSSLDSTLSTQFYPNTTGWSATTVATFDHPMEAARINRSLLASRPLAIGEPALMGQGRWLVTPGVTVEETAEGWKFQIAALPAEPLRPAMAELPLPDGWKPGSEALLSFEYRILRTESQNAGRPENQKVGGPESQNIQPPGHPAFRLSGSPALRPSAPPASPAERELPIFLTEYGYGLLGKDARSTPEGRARQEAWFSSVQTQIHALGIEGAMAFLLTPYLEADWNEFGLLVAAEKEPSRVESREPKAEATSMAPGAAQPFQLSAFNFQPSAALAALVSDSHRPTTPVTWSVPAVAAPPPVILDFVAGAGLAQAKSYAGYFMTGDTGRAGKSAEGQLVAYNVGTEPVSGELRLGGDAWTLSDGSHAFTLTLNPNERREIPVKISPTLRHFAPQSARATFHPMERPAKTDTSNPSPSKVRPSGVPSIQPSATPRPVQAAAPLQAQFETYLRTTNGNLYQTWPRPTATENWRPYSERLGNFTMAFFGRAQQPWRLAENTPAALVFFFRPGELPLTFEIRRPQVIEFAAP